MNKRFMNPSAMQLADLMSSISEDAICAGWLDGLEYSLWSHVVSGPAAFYRFNVTPVQVEMLRALANACEGWIAWSPNDPDGQGYMWVPLDTWKQHYADPQKFPLRPEGYSPRQPTRPQTVALLSSWKSYPNLRQLALLFDKLAFPHLYSRLDPDELRYLRVSEWERRELFDRAHMVVAGCALPSVPQYSDRVETGQLREQFRAAKSGSFEYEWAYSQLLAEELRIQQKVDALPLINRTDAADMPENRGVQVLRLIVDRLPCPDDSTPWEWIRDFRSDPDNLRRFAGLKDWINEMIRGELALNEIGDRLEWMCAQYEAAMETSRGRRAVGKFEFIVTVAADVAEYLTHKKWGQAVKRLLDARRIERIQLLEKEIAAPGAQLAYVAEARRGFGGQ